MELSLFDTVHLGLSLAVNKPITVGIKHFSYKVYLIQTKYSAQNIWKYPNHENKMFSLTKI